MLRTHRERGSTSLASNVSQYDIVSDSSDVEEQEDLTVECRNRFLMALKTIYFEMHEQNQVTASSFLILMESVNWDLDYQSERMNSWEFLSNYFHSPLQTFLLFKLKSVPIIGA
jgi:hypothetical protein